jgi:DNA invertase Pin-like site-specific DNA recombinase
VIDEDLGRSGSGRVERRGFEALLSEVCQGRAGAVFAIEASRFARNGHDWHRLLEFCQIVDTLIVDHDGVYDPKHPNDRLVLSPHARRAASKRAIGSKWTSQLDKIMLSLTEPIDLAP